MRITITKEQIDTIVSLKKQGLTNKEIGEKLGLKHGTVKAISIRELGAVRSTYKNTPEIIAAIEQARLTKTVKEVCLIFKKSPKRISELMRNSKVKHLFVKANINRVKKPKEVKPKKLKIDSLGTVEKGHLKLKPKEKVFQNKTFNPEKQRHIHIPSKNMTVSVKMNDTRTTQEIIESYESKDREFLASCKDNYMNRTKKKSKSSQK